jgi:hypothetical protein
MEVKFSDIVKISWNACVSAFININFSQSPKMDSVLKNEYIASAYIEQQFPIWRKFLKLLVFLNLSSHKKMNLVSICYDV